MTRPRHMDDGHAPVQIGRLSHVNTQPTYQASAVSTPKTLPRAEAAYLEQVATTLQNHLTQRLVGIYLFGSAAYGGYEPGISDLDVQAVVIEPLSTGERQEIARCLAHQRLPYVGLEA